MTGQGLREERGDSVRTCQKRDARFTFPHHPTLSDSTLKQHHFERRENELNDIKTIQGMPNLRGIHPLHPTEVAGTVRRVPQMVAFIINPVRCLFVTQVLLQLVLGSSVGPTTHGGETEPPS